MTQESIITTQVQINAPIEMVWELWNNPNHIIKWNNTDENWLNLKVENDLRPGGRFLYKMAKRDSSEKFDFTGKYDEVITHKLITYTLDDGRKTTLTFTGHNPVTITEAFEAEVNLPIEMQKEFCQAVLDTFKKYAEKS